MRHQQWMNDDNENNDLRSSMSSGCWACTAVVGTSVVVFQVGRSVVNDDQVIVLSQNRRYNWYQATSGVRIVVVLNWRWGR